MVSLKLWHLEDFFLEPLFVFAIFKKFILYVFAFMFF